MSKIANVKLSWKKSVSADVQKVVLTVSNNGTDSTVELGPEVEEFVIQVAASGSCHFSLTVTDSEGLTSTSAVYDFTLGDLEAPQPPTDLFHEVLSVVDDTPPTP